METFLNYRNFRWMWITAATLVVLTIIYAFDSPLGGRSGSSWLGYSYGILAAILILYLTWYGIRKRSYYSNQSTVQGCLAAHTWIGIGLLLLVPLHAAFQFGWNVHTLAYFFMVIVVLSGMYGAVCFVTLAPTIRAHRGGGSPKRLLDQIQQCSSDIEKLTRSGSTALQQLSRGADFRFQPTAWSCLKLQAVPCSDTALEAKLLGQLSSAEHGEGLKLLGLITKKRELALQLQHDVCVLSKLRIWLFIHVPVTIGLLVALAIHIFVVLMYR